MKMRKMQKAQQAEKCEKVLDKSKCCGYNIVCVC